MTTWNYRVFRELDGHFVFREVFYDEAGQRMACSQDPIEPSCETLDELRQMLQDLQIALQDPVLTLDDFPNAGPIAVPRSRCSQAEVVALLEKNSLLAG
jgi:hypothetical protein